VRSVAISLSIERRARSPAEKRSVPCGPMIRDRPEFERFNLSVGVLKVRANTRSPFCFPTLFTGRALRICNVKESFSDKRITAPIEDWPENRYQLACLWCPKLCYNSTAPMSSRTQKIALKRSNRPGDFLVSDAQVNAEGVHVWPFDPAFPVDVVRHTLSGEQPFRMNRHDYVEIVYLKSGALIWQVQENEVRESRGDLFVMLHSKYHRVSERSSHQARVESLFFHPSLLRSASPFVEESEYLRPFARLERSFNHVIPAATDLPGEIRRLIEKIRQELPGSSGRARLTIKTYVKMIMVHLLNYFSTQSNRPLPSNRREFELERFRPVFEFLEHNYSESISPTDAARTINMSPSHFRRAFRQLTGQAFVPFLNHFRIEKAQELLSKTEIPISDVGLDVGFCDQSYFGLVFRRLTKITPRQYRQRAIERRRNGTTLGQPVFESSLPVPLFR
jgi:AraC family transcriptional activator of pobA